MNNKAYEVYSLDFHTNIFLSTLNFYKSEIGHVATILIIPIVATASG